MFANVKQFVATVKLIIKQLFIVFFSFSLYDFVFNRRTTFLVTIKSLSSWSWLVAVNLVLFTSVFIVWMDVCMRSRNQRGRWPVVFLKRRPWMRSTHTLFWVSELSKKTSKVLFYHAKQLSWQPKQKIEIWRLFYRKNCICWHHCGFFLKNYSKNVFFFVLSNFFRN